MADQLSTNPDVSTLHERHAGRPRTSLNHKHFIYDPDNDTSTCIVDGCNRLIKSRNPTNLKSHLLNYHKDAHRILLEEEKQVKTAKETAETGEGSARKKTESRPKKAAVMPYPNSDRA